ncbi:SRPBCC domain-containing protein [uncultured Maricaulis sp.]|uniref:SRPBCC domain-containing protein n=1 Tax=uncultured Maricaulis sp. TaxID=174710 RepID=UPI0030D8EBF0|tara:strand:+ start:73168 stop:73647 length:480 start_codon:yes stop_codon:yes gene_type:complete
MSAAPASHESFTLTRQMAAPPAVVFRAWADPAARTVWSAPSAAVEIVYDAADFRLGGCDVVRCVEPDMPVFAAEVCYHDIVEDRRIIFAESVSRGDERMAAALISVEIVAEGEGSTLTVTLQLVSLDIEGMGSNYRLGWTAALDNLQIWVNEAGAGGRA